MARGARLPIRPASSSRSSVRRAITTMTTVTMLSAATRRSHHGSAVRSCLPILPSQAFSEPPPDDEVDDALDWVEGLDGLGAESFEPDSFEPEPFEPESLEPESFEP